MYNFASRFYFLLRNSNSWKDIKVFHKYAAIFILALAGLVIGYLFWNLMLPRKDFYNELWGPAYLLVSGQSPYNTASLNPVLPAAWLPMAIGFFFPLGWLTEKNALQVWYFYNILAVCFIIYLVQGKNINLFNTTALILICFFSPFTINHINLGQFSITATLAWVLAVYFLEKDRHWISTFFIALALTKPHLGFLAMLGLSFYYFQMGGVRSMFLFWVRTISMCLILCLPLFVAHPNWIPDALVSMRANPPWLYPSLYILFERHFDEWGRILWGFITLIIISANFWMWKKLPMKHAVYWSLALTLLATPYLGSWDFVVLFPLFIATYIHTGWKAKVFFWSAYGMAWFGMARVQMLAESHNHFFWWVPLLFISTLILITNWRLQHEE
jgi:hypothetical protein